MQLYNLWMANPSRRDEFSGASIEGTIKKFASAKPQKKPSARKRPQKQDRRSPTTALNIFELWDRACLTERTRFLRNVGLKPLALALPEDWLRSIECYLRERQQTVALPPPDERMGDEYPDLPDFLQRPQLAAQSILSATLDQQDECRCPVCSGRGTDPAGSDNEYRAVPTGTVVPEPRR
jgi:hypothetical protein